MISTTDYNKASISGNSFFQNVERIRKLGITFEKIDPTCLIMSSLLLRHGLNYLQTINERCTRMVWDLLTYHSKPTFQSIVTRRRTFPDATATSFSRFGWRDYPLNIDLKLASTYSFWSDYSSSYCSSYSSAYLHLKWYISSPLVQVPQGRLPRCLELHIFLATRPNTFDRNAVTFSSFD